MKAAVTFQAQTREALGKGASRALRRAGKVPANIYGMGKGNLSVAIEDNEVSREYWHGGFFSKIIGIDTGGEKFMVLPKDIQMHPVNEKILHVDFFRVDEKSSIDVQVPVHFLNQEKCPGIKRGGTLNIVRHELELACSAGKIPPYIEIDLAAYDIGDSIHISQVSLPEGVESTIADRDFTIATIAGRSAEEEEEEPVEVAADEVPAEQDKSAEAEAGEQAEGDTDESKS